jgi:acyl-coenzyme A thioesterase PaaI-like protein
MNKVISLQHDCFVCGSKEHSGMGVIWHQQVEGTIFSEATFTLAQQGSPGNVHSGATAALLDEAMGLAIWYAGYRVVTVNLNITYHRPIPLGEKTHIVARFSGIENLQFFTKGEIFLANGKTAVTAFGTFAEATHFLTDLPK